MANTIRIKRRASGSSGAPTSLANAELAFNEVDNTLYYGKGTGGVGGTATSVEAIAGKGAFVDLSSTQTVGGVKTFSSTISGSVDGNAGTATKLANARDITASGDIAWTVSFDGSANASAAATLATVNSNVGSFTKLTVNGKGLVTAASAATLADLGTTAADFSMNGYKITSLADPVSAQDAATKNYVDSVAQGLDPKQSVRAATTANITLSGTQTIDGVSLSVDDRVLVKNQSTASQNGIYLVKSSTWARAEDMDAWAEVPNAFTFVEEGSTQADTGWVCTSNAGGTLGSTAVDWVQFSSAGSYTAGNGIDITAGVISAKLDGSTLSVSGSGLKVSDTYAGNSSLTTLGTVTTGTWNATTVGVGYGGTGATSFTSNGIIYGNGSSSLQVTGAGTWDSGAGVGQLLSVDSGGVPTWTNTVDGGTF